jgi:ComEC/Rec2-related protein
MSALAVGCSMLIAGIGGWPFVILISVASIVAVRWFGRKTLLHIPLAILAAVWVNSVLPGDIDHAVAEQSYWRLEVTSMPTMRAQGWSFDARIRDGVGAGERVLVYTYDDHSVALGDEIFVTGAFQLRDELDDASYRSYLDGRGVGAQIYAGRIEVDRQGTGVFAWLNRQRQAMVFRAMNAVPGDAGSLMAGLVTGDDGKLAEQTDLEFKRSGLTHLTAVSGANLAFAVLLIVKLGRVARRKRNTLLVAGIFIAWLYTAFVGLSPPTMRAALYVTVIAGGRMAGRPIDPLPIAVFTAVLQLAIRPEDAFSISFQLSVAASIGLSAGLGRYPHDGDSLIFDWIKATILAQVATAFVIGATFGQLSMLSFFANVIAAPIMVLAFPFSCIELLLLTINSDLGAAFGQIAKIPVDWLLRVASIYGQEWAVLSLPAVNERLMLAGSIAILTAVAMMGGEMYYIKRNVRERRFKPAPGR